MAQIPIIGYLLGLKVPWPNTVVESGGMKRPSITPHLFCTEVPWLDMQVPFLIASLLLLSGTSALPWPLGTTRMASIGRSATAASCRIEFREISM